MPEVTYRQPDGSHVTHTAVTGTSVMQAAVLHGVEGIVAECGGSMMCATCHVYVADAWAARLPPIEEVEDEMLDSTAAPRRATSRLSCQIVLGADTDGIVVDTPECQQ
ncbi:2Fe-2S iron-sulfur cluster-binding protein [Streptomyces sp. NPDC050560]|uniref:2Fe-2S iron-sulfur cluster-binding protein n=1 Tax=Streptomyces sp. NPDC050560 TaxID=3365630 RepID=UPI00378FB37B